MDNNIFIKNIHEWITDIRNSIMDIYILYIYINWIIVHIHDYTLIDQCTYPTYLWREIIIYDRFTAPFSKVGCKPIKSLFWRDAFPSYIFLGFGK